MSPYFHLLVSILVSIAYMKLSTLSWLCPFVTTRLVLLVFIQFPVHYRDIILLWCILIECENDWLKHICLQMVVKAHICQVYCCFFFYHTMIVYIHNCMCIYGFLVENWNHLNAHNLPVRTISISLIMVGKVIHDSLGSPAWEQISISERVNVEMLHHCEGKYIWSYCSLS